MVQTMYRELDKGHLENIPFGPSHNVLRTFSESPWDNIESKPSRDLMGKSPNVLRTSPVFWVYSM